MRSLLRLALFGIVAVLGIGIAGAAAGPKLVGTFSGPVSGRAKDARFHVRGRKVQLKDTLTVMREGERVIVKSALHYAFVPDPENRLIAERDGIVKEEYEQDGDRILKVHFGSEAMRHKPWYRTKVQLAGGGDPVNARVTFPIRDGASDWKLRFHKDGRLSVEIESWGKRGRITTDDLRVQLVFNLGHRGRLSQKLAGTLKPLE